MVSAIFRAAALEGRSDMAGCLMVSRPMVSRGRMTKMRRLEMRAPQALPG